MRSSLLLLATSLALLELDDLSLVADTLALVWLWLPLAADGGSEVTNGNLVAAADGQGGVLLNLQVIHKMIVKLTKNRFTMYYGQPAYIHRGIESVR